MDFYLQVEFSFFKIHNIQILQPRSMSSVNTQVYGDKLASKPTMVVVQQKVLSSLTLDMQICSNN